MTDIPALDAEIVKAAEAWFAKAPAEYRDRFHAEACAIFDAVAAKRAADKPKPLSAEEALRLYDASCGPLAVEHPKAVQAVLDAAAERWRVVIDHALDAQFPGGGNSHERAMRETIRSILRGGSR